MFIGGRSVLRLEAGLHRRLAVGWWGPMKRAFELLSRHAETSLAALLVVVAVGLGIFQLTSVFTPIVHEQHNWRQADVFSVAYTFHNDGFDFLHPRIDFWRGKTGIVGMEAPVYPAFVHF